MNQNNSSNNSNEVKKSNNCATEQKSWKAIFMDGAPSALMAKKPNKNCSNTNDKNKDSSKSKK